jgi:5-methylcytosine-specific restriction endonuclease McrA
MSKLVWVETTAQGVPVRIFTSRSKVTRGYIMKMNRSEAVKIIRHQLWLRCAGECEICAAPVTEDSGHMHERVHRGKGGEISLENSVFICPPCHRREHADRNPRFSKKGNYIDNSLLQRKGE